MEAQLNSLIDAVRQAAADGRTLRLRGGGSKDFWGQSLTGEVLSTRDYRGIVSYEPSELVVTVRCGTALAELEAALAEKGQSLAFEPPHFGPDATVGGMVAAGLSGPARATVGAVRDYVLGARFINGLGEHLTFGGQVMKNVAGYDVSRLMAGSWGTLGLITEVSLKVLPVAPAEATLMIAGLAQGPALDLLHRWGGQPLPLNASAWVRDTMAQPVADYLFVRLRGAVAAVQSAVVKMSADAVALGARVQAMDNAEAAQDWRASNEQTLPFFDAPSADACLWRLSVPQTAPVLDLPYAQYMEWQGAQRWLWAPASAAATVREMAQKVGGHATLFRASAKHAEADKAAGVNTPLDAVQQRIQQQLQKQFDPKGIFATGRLHPF
ncbi:glycolate oxidase subunit GlcE [Limnohabitans sp. 63ED37-2]|uniref:glycolate oxidase subunit GlcE n=1 Tax=Limnohabitans sp. 63ED37-2 TaxID=1678128 RepID=UPI0007057A1A|nr:glycolate oxidase subunit GlcE [Limnohabitans sp. 63ED37-2]ALK90067.1 putative FAD-linked oxidoreductase [Limnohabitans sp. 63ED37-2]